MDPADFQAPRLVTAGVGLLLLLAGAWVILKTALRANRQDTPTTRWLNDGLMLATLLLFAVLCLWTGFRPASASGGSLATRALFGGLGGLALLITGWLARSKWRAAGPRPAPQEKK
jgi:hypothetical protein